MHIGHLELIIGPMFSGKTSELISLYRKYSLSKMNPCIINYAEDTRYDTLQLCTHDLIKIPCINSLTLGEVLTEEIISKHQVILINEGQFFPDLYDQVRYLVDIRGKIVHVCGLDGDFHRQKFGQILDLISISDKVTKHHAVCMKCENGTSGIFSHRLTSEQDVKVIGSNNYIPVCRKCYLTLNKLTNQNIN